MTIAQRLHRANLSLGERERMKNFKKKNIQTTLGDLITALSEEIRPFLRNEKETSIVVGYIFNDLVRRSRSKEGHRRMRHRPSLFLPFAAGQIEKS
jgi:hypothetical protein